jgi:hypothetical protein
MAHFKIKVLSKCSILKNTVYALEGNDIAELQWRAVDGCESIHDAPGYFAHAGVHIEMYSMVHENTGTTL